jgi:hypothetical protein
MPGLIRERREERRTARKAKRAARQDARKARRSGRVAKREHKKAIKAGFKEKKKSGKYSVNDKSFFRQAARAKGMNLKEYYDKYVNYR